MNRWVRLTVVYLKGCRSLQRGSSSQGESWTLGQARNSVKVLEGSRILTATLVNLPSGGHITWMTGQKRLPTMEEKPIE
jgi:hypothetical protein